MDDETREILKAIAAGKTDVPSPGEFIRWFGAKTPEGILVLAVSFCVFSIGLWILSYALRNLGML